MTANGSTFLRYAVIISVPKLTQVIKSYTAGFLRIQTHNRKILKRILDRQIDRQIGQIDRQKVSSFDFNKYELRAVKKYILLKDIQYLKTILLKDILN